MASSSLNSTTENKDCTIGTQINSTTCNIMNHKRFPISEPSFSSLPTLADTFVGRDEEMKEITKFIFTAEEEHKMIVISGFSGFGKSEFVKRFVYAHKDQCNILWINAGTEEKIKESFIQIFNIKNENYNNILVKSYCESLNKRTIIIFDNALKRENIRKYEVYSKKIHYIITSTNQQWESHIKIMILRELTQDAALQIFKNVIKEKFKVQDVETYKKIAKLVGYVPLTLQVVASYLFKKNRALRETFVLQNYLEQLEKPEPNNFAIVEKLPEYSSTDYKKSFYSALKMSIDSIKSKNSKKSVLALNIVNTCAFLFSQRIQYNDFLNIPYFKKQLDRQEIFESNIREACDLLRDYSLININSEEESFQIHDLVQKTLIYHQNSSSIDQHNVFFYSNLEMLLDENDTTEFHRNFILNPTFNMIHTFQNFVRDYYFQIANSYVLCRNLIFSNSQLYLNEIFNKMGKVLSKYYINHGFLLHEAVRSEHYNMVELIINCDADVNLKCVHSNNQTALMWAAFIVNLEIIKLLANKSCLVNVVDNNNNNVLFYLMQGINNIRNKHKSKEAVEILRLLVDKGANVTARGFQNKSLLHVAAQALNVDIMKCLIDEYKLNVNDLDTIGRTPIFYISRAEDIDRKRRLIAAKFLVYAGTDLKLKNKFGETAAEETHNDGPEYLYKYYTSTNCDQDFTDVEENPRADKLLRVIAEGNLNAVRRLFEELGEQATQLAQLCQAPHQAVRYKKYKILEFLLDHDVPVDSRGEDNRTILHTAVQNIDFDAIKILVDRKADNTLTDIYGCSVLSYLILGVIDNYDKEDMACDILKWLIEQGANPEHVNNDKSTLVHTAARASTPHLLRCLVQGYGLNINAVDIDGTALHAAILCKDIIYSEDHWWKTIRCLLDLGVRLDITNKRGKLPVEIAKEQNLPTVAYMLELWRAVTEGNLDVLLEMFEEIGEQTTQLAETCQAPHEAVLRKKYKILEFFLDHGVPVDFRGKNRRTLLHTAAQNIDLKAIKILVGRGADLTATGAKRWSVLFYLIFGITNKYDKEDEACSILKWLVEKGADPKHVDNYKSTLIHIAARVSTPRLLRCLVQDYGLNVNAIDIIRTALHVAILYKNASYSEIHCLETIRCLLDLGARLDITDKYGKTPIEVARELNHHDIEYLFTTFVKKNYKSY